MNKYLGKVKLDKVKILDEAMRILFSKLLFYHNSIDDYKQERQPSHARMTMFWLNYLILSVFNFKYGFVAFYPDKFLSTPLRDATMILGNQARLLHGLLGCISMVVLFGKLALFYYERRKELDIINIITNWKNNKPGYRLNYVHENSVTFKSHILVKWNLKILGNLVFVLMTISCIIITLGAYFYCDYGNLFMLCFWALIFWQSSNQISFVAMSGPFLFYVPITIFNYKIDELINRIRASVKWYNVNSLSHILYEYNQVTLAIKQISKFYNMIIGLVYGIMPFFLAIMIETMRIERDDLLYIFIKCVAIIIFILANMNAFIINQISASITVRNKSIHKYLYPIFFNEKSADFEIKLKIDSFISRLHSQYIGFYCFNLFKFTKMAFYQFALTIIYCYCLLWKFF